MSVLISDTSELTAGSEVTCFLYSGSGEGTAVVYVDWEEQETIDLAEDVPEFTVTIPESGTAEVQIEYTSEERDEQQTLTFEITAGK